MTVPQSPYYYTLKDSTVPDFKPEDLQISTGNGLLMVNLRNHLIENKDLLIPTTEDGSFTFQLYFTDDLWIKVSICSRLHAIPECYTWSKVCDVKTKKVIKVVFFFRDSMREKFESIESL